MYKYEYEKVTCQLKSWGVVAGNVYSINEHKKIIEKRANSGWRYVGFIPTKQRGTGHIQELELIFEKTEK